MPIKKWMVVLWMMMLAMATHAQGNPVVVDHYTTDDGLPCNYINCALKDRDGFLWFGTWYGLCRFDGSHFRSYKHSLHADSDIPPRKIESMTEDRQGNIWLKTVDWKVYVFYRKTERFHALGDELKKVTPNLQIIKMQPTDDGHVLLLTKDKNVLLAITDKDGRILLQTLFSSKGKFNPYNYLLYKDHIVSAHGFTCFVGRDRSIFATRQGQRFHQLMADWQRAEEQRKARLQALATEAGITDYAQLYEDRDHLLWASSMTNGVYCIRRPHSPFRLIPLANDLTGTRNIFQASDGRIFVSTRSRNAYVLDEQGNLLETHTYERYGIGAVYHAMEDHRHRMWLSTKGDGLVVGIPNPKSPYGSDYIHYRHNPADPKSISGDAVYMTYCDSKGRTWVATLDGGLNLVEEDKDGHLTFINRNNGFTSYPAFGQFTEVRNLVEDSRHRLWIGTIDGLMSIDLNFHRPADIRFETYQQLRGATFANNDIYTLYKDHRNRIWVGAFGGGLGVMTDYSDRRPQFHMLGIREGLHSDNIISIEEDAQGRLWFATENGIASYQSGQQRIHSFDRYDGLPPIHLEEAASRRLQDGQLWFGCREGILAFHPEHLTGDTTRYPTFITAVYSNNRDVNDVSAHQPYATPFIDHLQLDHDQGSFTIEFSALNFKNIHSVNYRYRLKGYDQDWIYCGGSQHAYYTKVPPGNYTFTVEALDDGNHNLQSSRTISIRILPPWWATWWAYLIYLACIVAISIIIVRTVLKMNRMRNEIIIGQRLARIQTHMQENAKESVHEESSNYQEYVEQKGMEFIDHVHRIIDQNLQNPDFNIDTIAQEMGLSRSAFFKKVKTVTGFSPLDLVKEFRLSRAAELLKRTDLSITEVAYRSGFKDSGYFGKCFRKRYGQSPRDYAAANRE